MKLILSSGIEDFSAEEAKRQTLAAVREEIERRVAGLECQVHHAGPSVSVDVDGVKAADDNCCAAFKKIVDDAIDKDGAIKVDVEVVFSLE